MPQQDRQTGVGKALEFAVFVGTPVTLFSPHDPESQVLLKVRDVGEGAFVGRVEGEPPPLLEARATGPLAAMMPYKQRFLKFSTRRLPAPDGRLEPGDYLFELPESGELTARRREPRVSLEHRDGLLARLEVATQIGAMAFSATRLVDASHSSLSLYLRRADGLVLPGDAVPCLRVYRGDDLAFETRGRIVRVDTRNGTAQGDYLAVVGFEAPDGVAEAKEESDGGKAYFLEDGSAFVSFRHPLFDEAELQGVIAEISTHDATVVLNPTRFPLAGGLVLRRFQIQLPFQPRFETTLKVVGCRRMDDESGCRYRVSGTLEGVSPELYKALSLAIQSNVDPHVVEASSEDREQLWEFLFETGFIYGDKRKQLQDRAQQLLATYDQILRSNAPFVKKLLYKEGDAIKGHISSVKYFDSAWLIQHLNALRSPKSASAAQAVIFAMSDFFRDCKSFETTRNAFVICFYRPDNLYPALVFGGIKDFIGDSRLCNAQDLDFHLLCGERPLRHAEVRHGVVSCREAEADDLYRLEDLLIRRGHYNLMRVEGLTAEGMVAVGIGEEYRKIGLYRYRKVHVAELPGTGESAYAVCNYASPGLNLSELTNSFRLFYTSEDVDANMELATAIAGPVIRSYGETEMPSPVLLADPGETVPIQYRRAKTYRYWQLDLNHVDAFKKGARHVFDNIREHLRAYAAAAAEEAGTAPGAGEPQLEGRGSV